MAAGETDRALREAALRVRRRSGTHRQWASVASGVLNESASLERLVFGTDYRGEAQGRD